MCGGRQYYVHHRLRVGRPNGAYEPQVCLLSHGPEPPLRAFGIVMIGLDRKPLTAKELSRSTRRIATAKRVEDYVFFICQETNKELSELDGHPRGMTSQSSLAPVGLIGAVYNCI